MPKKKRTSFPSAPNLALIIAGGRKVVDDSDEEEITETKYILPTYVVDYGD